MKFLKPILNKAESLWRKGEYVVSVLAWVKAKYLAVKEALGL